MIQIDAATYLNLAQNGARTLFDILNIRLLDGTKDETDSYFVLYFLEEEEEPLYFEIDLKTAFDWLARYYCIDEVFNKYLVEDIMREIVMCMAKQIPLYCITEEK